MPFIKSNEYGLAEALVRYKHEVTIITSKGRAPREKMMTGRGSPSLDFEVRYIPTIMNIEDNPLVASTDTTGFDVVLLQEDYPFLCHRAYSSAKRNGIPTILSSERTYYPQNAIKRYILKILDARQNRRLREGADALTAHCGAAREFMIKELKVKREIEVIHVGVDTGLFKPLPSGNKYMRDGDLKILTVARLHRYKGLDYLIRSMEIVCKKNPGTKLYILGKGHEEKKLRKMTERSGLSNVEFIEEVIPNHMMPHLYAECDIYVQPSIIEPYGIAVLEAMACGKPVIGTGVGGMLDTIDNDHTGFLVKPKDAGALAEAFMRLQDDAVRKKMGEAARRRAVEVFGWDVIGRKYMDLIETVVKR
jgi:glycosyltransferase involved in cell wall biosynthesis